MKHCNILAIFVLAIVLGVSAGSFSGCSKTPPPPSKNTQTGSRQQDDGDDAERLDQEDDEDAEDASLDRESIESKIIGLFKY